MEVIREPRKEFHPDNSRAACAQCPKSGLSNTQQSITLLRWTRKSKNWPERDGRKTDSLGGGTAWAERTGKLLACLEVSKAKACHMHLSIKALETERAMAQGSQHLAELTYGNSTHHQSQYWQRSQETFLISLSPNACFHRHDSCYNLYVWLIFSFCDETPDKCH